MAELQGLNLFFIFLLFVMHAIHIIQCSIVSLENPLSRALSKTEPMPSSSNMTTTCPPYESGRLIS